MRTVLSAHPLASRVPDGLKSRDMTHSSYPVKTRKHLPERRFHTRTVMSIPPLANMAWWGWNAVETTPSLCSRSVRIHSQVFVFQILTVLSSLALAKSDPFGLNRLEYTNALCPLSMCETRRWEAFALLRVWIVVIWQSTEGRRALRFVQYELWESSPGNPGVWPRPCSTGSFASSAGS